MTAIIEIEPRSLTATGQRYAVFFDGQEIVKSTRNPLTDGARELSRMGVTGVVRMKRVGAQDWDASGLIAVLAALTVSENQNHGPRLVKYAPHFATNGSAAQ